MCYLCGAKQIHRMEVILEYLLNNWPSFTVVLIVGVTCFIVARKFTKWEDRHDRKHEDLEKGMLNISSDMGETASMLKSIGENMETIEKDVIILKSVMAMKYKNFMDVLSLKHSPRKLNDNGERILSDINGDEFLQRNKNFLFAKIDEQHPKTALDVELAANFVLLSNMNNDIFNDLKIFVYNAPTYMMKDGEDGQRPYDLDMNDICFVLSLPLRDMYLAEHEEILTD